MATPNHATHLTRIFPNLWGGGYAVIGPPSDQYNCIAYAAGDTSQHWEDDNPNSYWHPDAKRGTTTADLAVLFRKLGFKKCGGPRLEPKYQKVALYGKQVLWTHAALQTSNGRWRSKLGKEGELIEHGTPDDLIGDEYGRPYMYMQKLIP